MAHFNMQFWNDMRRQFYRSDFQQFYPQRGQDKDKPAIVFAHDKGEDLHLVVNPQRDLFYLVPRDFGLIFDWETLVYDLTIFHFGCILHGALILAGLRFVLDTVQSNLESEYPVQRPSYLRFLLI